MTDIRDPEFAERLDHVAPDQHLRHRDFLSRTAKTAGLAAGLATTLSPTTLVAEAARRQHRAQLNGGACEGFMKTGNDVFAICYYKEGDLGFIQDAAKAFTTFDHFHCSLMAATLPNREYMHAATSYGEKDNNLPPQTDNYKTGFPDNTIFASLAAAGVPNRYFYT